MLSPVLVPLLVRKWPIGDRLESTRSKEEEATNSFRVRNINLDDIPALIKYASKSNLSIRVWRMEIFSAQPFSNLGPSNTQSETSMNASELQREDSISVRLPH